MTKKLKYPKAPGANASVKTLENYMKRCNEVSKANARIEAEEKKRKTLIKRISEMRKKY